jgi:hypothetical protein
MIQRTWSPQINIHAPLASGLVFAGLGGGASTLLYQDASGRGNSGTLTAMDPPSDWVFVSELGRRAINLNGVDQYVDIPKISGIKTVCCWANIPFPPYEGKYGYIVDFRDGGTGAGYVYFGPEGGATPFNFSGGTGYRNGVAIATGTNVTTNVTAHFAVTGMTTVCNANFPIGKRYTSVNYLIGNVSDLLLYNRNLSLAEIQQLADPSNTLLSGLILPPRRKLWPVATSGTYASTIEMPVFQLTI